MQYTPLNDIFTNWIAQGIFSYLQNDDVPWKDLNMAAALDLAYHGGHAGDKLAGRILTNLMTNGELSDDNKQNIANALFAVYGKNWQKLYNTLDLDYNPIYNVEAHITETTTGSGTKDTTDNTAGTGTITHDTSENATQEHTGTDNHATTNSETQDDTGTDNHAITKSETGHDTGADTHAISKNEETAETGTDNHATAEGISESTKTDNGIYGYNSDTATNADTSTQTKTGNNTGSDNETKDLKSTLTVTDGDTETKDLTNTFTADDADNETRALKSEKTGSGSDNETRNLKDTEERTGKDTETRDTNDTRTANEKTSDTQEHTLYRYGNIGVTTSQQMIQEERDLWAWYFYKNVFADIDEFLTLSVY